MRLLLNIGTEPGKGFGPDMGSTARAQALRDWLERNTRVLGYQIRQVPGEEQVIILDVSMSEAPGTNGLLYSLSTALQQDCIAVWNCELGVGSLIGPNAAAWQPFNPAKFYMTARQGSEYYPGEVIH